MHDVVIRNGTIHDGEGGSPYAADVAIDGDLIVAVMPAIGDRGRREIDASGLAVAPGFINVLSWAIPSLIADGARRAMCIRASRSKSSARDPRWVRSPTRC